MFFFLSKFYSGNELICIVLTPTIFCPNVQKYSAPCQLILQITFNIYFWLCFEYAWPSTQLEATMFCLYFFKLWRETDFKIHKCIFTLFQSGLVLPLHFPRVNTLNKILKIAISVKITTEFFLSFHNIWIIIWMLARFCWSNWTEPQFFYCKNLEINKQLIIYTF